MAKPKRKSPARRKPAARRAAKPSRPAKVEVRIDQALKKRWKSAIAEVERARREGASAFDERWEAIGEIVNHDPPLYLAGGIASRGAFFTRYVEESPRSAERMIKVAAYASPAEESRYGVSKIDAAIALLEARSGGPPKGRIPVDFAKLRIPLDQPRDGARSVLFAKASVEDVRRATRALAPQYRSKVKQPALVAAIRGALAAAKVKGVTVRLAGGRITLGGIDPEAIGDVAKALAGVKASSDDGG